MTLVGFTALSVEMKMKRAAPNASAAFTTLSVPNTLLCSASRGHASMSGTCLCAAAWNTAPGRYFANTSATRASSHTLPISMTISMSSYSDSSSLRSM